MSLPELQEWYIKWHPFLNSFLQSVDRRTGSLLHLPFNGGLFEQPSKTMTIFTIMQEMYFVHLADELKQTKNRRK